MRFTRTVLLFYEILRNQIFALFAIPPFQNWENLMTRKKKTRWKCPPSFETEETKTFDVHLTAESLGFDFALITVLYGILKCI